MQASQIVRRGAGRRNADQCPAADPNHAYGAIVHSAMFHISESHGEPLMPWSLLL